MKILSEEDLKSGFARRLKLLRKALGFRFAPAFAERAGINVDTYFKYEQGYRLPEAGRPEWQMIRNASGATVDWLLYGDENSLPTSLRITLSEYEQRQNRKS